MLLLEIFAVMMGILFIILLINENIWCWLFGILSSSAFVFLMYNVQLYSESILYIFYVAIGFYGWKQWNKQGDDKIVVGRKPWMYLLIVTIIGAIVSLLVGYIFDNNTDAQRPYADASTSVFSILASYLEAHKLLSAWVYWIVINACSIWLYFDRSLNLSSFLMVVYFLLSIFGFLQWQKKIKEQEQSLA